MSLTESSQNLNLRASQKTCFLCSSNNLPHYCDKICSSSYKNSADLTYKPGSVKRSIILHKGAKTFGIKDINYKLVSSAEEICNSVNLLTISDVPTKDKFFADLTEVTDFSKIVMENSQPLIDIGKNDKHITPTVSIKNNSTTFKSVDSNNNNLKNKPHDLIKVYNFFELNFSKLYNMMFIQCDFNETFRLELADLYSIEVDFSFDKFIDQEQKRYNEFCKHVNEVDNNMLHFDKFLQSLEVGETKKNDANTYYNHLSNNLQINKTIPPYRKFSTKFKKKKTIDSLIIKNNLPTYEFSTAPLKKVNSNDSNDSSCNSIKAWGFFGTLKGKNHKN
ncbi:hypothetical protein QEN19_003971 [Hanseniaspora menglaensis]